MVRNPFYEAFFVFGRAKRELWFNIAKFSYIANNHPLTKNKPVYHARISEQMNGEGFPSHFICSRSERDKSVYFWSRSSYLPYNGTIVEEIQRKPTSFTSKRGDPHSAILFILSTETGITPLTESSNNGAKTMHFVVKSSFIVCLFVNVTLHNNGEY